jgi:hypothetical protein
MMRRTTLLSIAALFAGASSLAAQDSVHIATGNRVRVTAPRISGTRIVGTYARMDADTFVVEVGGDTRSFPRTAVIRLEVSVGRKGNAEKGALYGALLGAGIGALALGTSSLCADLEAGGTCALVGAGGGGLGGLLIGALIGSVSKTDRWQTVPVAAAPVSYLRWDRRRLLLGASIGF